MQTEYYNITSVMKSPKAAWEAIEQRILPLPKESIPRAEAVGRVLAESVNATVDMPQADVSAMDGYASAGEPVLGQPLPVTGVAAAGAPPLPALKDGDVVKIMTGAIVPPGADRVIPVELSDGGHERVVFERSEPVGRHIRWGGEVVATGDELLPAGTVLRPATLSLLAGHGYAAASVHRTPTVAVLTTGDELVPPEAEPGPGQLRDSNSTFLLTAGLGLGLRFHHLGNAPDQPGALRDLIAQGLEHDVLLLSGGVSMGDYDLVEGVLDELGCTALFDRVAIQPGKPLVAAVHERAQSSTGWVFGLPGNPGSVIVTFSLYVRPLLRRLMGYRDGLWQEAIPGVLTAELPAAKKRERYLPAVLEGHVNGFPGVRPLPPRGSHDVVAFALADALVRIPAESPPTPAGERCEIMVLGR